MIKCCDSSVIGSCINISKCIWNKNGTFHVGQAGRKRERGKESFVIPAIKIESLAGNNKPACVYICLKWTHTLKNYFNHHYHCNNNNCTAITEILTTTATVIKGRVYRPVTKLWDSWQTTMIDENNAYCNFPNPASPCYLISTCLYCRGKHLAAVAPEMSDCILK